MENKFELGPLQKMWVAALRAHPERQGRGYLGRLNKDSRTLHTTGDYRACCLGELHLCYHRLNNLPLPLDDSGSIFDQSDRNPADGSYSFLSSSYKRYGLRDEYGSFSVARCMSDGIVRHFGHMDIGSFYVSSLSQANDNGATWIEIADFIENNPEVVFTHSV